MDDAFYKRVRSAAVAGWWTALIATAWLTIVWFVWLGLLKSHCDCVLNAWGGGLTWPEIQHMVLWFFGVMKILLYLWVLACVWLTLWARKLKQAS